MPDKLHLKFNTFLCLPFQEVIQKFAKLKSLCQEIQRDMTTRRCLTRKDEIAGLMQQIDTLQGQLQSHFTVLDAKQQAMEKVWTLLKQNICF